MLKVVQFYQYFKTSLTGYLYANVGDIEKFLWLVVNVCNRGHTFGERDETHETITIARQSA